MKLSQLKQQIEELDAKATKGPWKNKAFGYEVESPCGPVCQMAANDGRQREIDGDFIAFSRDALPYMLRKLLVAEDGFRILAKRDWTRDSVGRIADAALATIRGEEE